MAEKINIEGREITVRQVNDQDYISLTDMVRNHDEPDQVIRNWLRTIDTIEYLAAWETLYNPKFKPVEFDRLRREAGTRRFTLSVTKWCELTNAAGIISKRGRGGGTFAHSDIAFNFGGAISPMFHLLLIREFQRLKSEEFNRHKLEWNETRFLSKINAGILSESIKENLVNRDTNKSRPYASAFDMVNLAVFDMTAKEWRSRNPELKGNIRDHASTLELILISNLESLNAVYIDAGANYEARLVHLYKIAEKQRQILEEDKRLNEDKKFLE